MRGDLSGRAVEKSAGAPGAGWHDPFDAGFTRRLADEALSPMLTHWFRPRLIGRERLPASGPCVLAANHSGTAFPYDGMVLDILIWIREGKDPARKLRSVYEKELSSRWWMRPFGIDDFWRRAGGVDMTFDNFDRLLARGDRVAYYPEGVPGIGKGFSRRYELQPFRSSFVVLAARHRAPVFPVYVINAEWVVPFNFTLRPVDRLMQAVWRVPFLPLPAAPLGIVFPWAWWMAFPARMIFVIGEPIDVRALAEAAGETDFERPDRARMRAVAERVRAIMQPELKRLVARYGRRPFAGRELWHALRDARRKRRLARILPTGWPATFVRLARDQCRGPARGRVEALLRDWDLLGFYLPFGWPLLSLTRALRRPPYGYRGLSPADRREREGRYVWDLADRPLPPRERSALGRERVAGP